jgi:hypothetical protein
MKGRRLVVSAATVVLLFAISVGAGAALRHMHKRHAKAKLGSAVFCQLHPDKPRCQTPPTTTAPLTTTTAPLTTTTAPLTTTTAPLTTTTTPPPTTTTPPPTTTTPPPTTTTPPPASLCDGLSSCSFADMESGNLSQFQQVSTTSNATLAATQVERFGGVSGALASYLGGGANAYARGVWEPIWSAGTTVTYGAAFKLPAGFYAVQQGQIDLIRWDNFPTQGTQDDFGGIVIYGSDKRARLVRGINGVEEAVIGPSFALPEGQWFTLRVTQTLSATNSLSTVLLNGATVVSSTTQNSYGRAIDRLRIGLVAVDAGRQTNPLALYFDNAFEGVGS